MGHNISLEWAQQLPFNPRTPPPPPYTEVNSRRRGEIEQKSRDNEGETKREWENSSKSTQSAGPASPPVKIVGIYKPNVSNQCKHWLGHGRLTTVRVPKSTWHSKSQCQSKDTDITSRTAAATHTHLSKTACKRTIIFTQHACTFIRNWNYQSTAKLDDGLV